MGNSGAKIFRTDRLAGPRVQHGRQGLGQIRLEVVPGVGNLIFVQQVLDLVAHQRNLP